MGRLLLALAVLAAGFAAAGTHLATSPNRGPCGLFATTPDKDLTPLHGQDALRCVAAAAIVASCPQGAAERDSWRWGSFAMFGSEDGSFACVIQVGEEQVGLRAWRLTLPKLEHRVVPRWSLPEETQAPSPQPEPETAEPECGC